MKMRNIFIGVRRLFGASLVLFRRLGASMQAANSAPALSLAEPSEFCVSAPLSKPAASAPSRLPCSLVVRAGRISRCTTTPLRHRIVAVRPKPLRIVAVRPKPLRIATPEIPLARMSGTPSACEFSRTAAEICPAEALAQAKAEAVAQARAQALAEARAEALAQAKTRAFFATVEFNSLLFPDAETEARRRAEVLLHAQPKSAEELDTINALRAARQFFAGDLKEQPMDYNLNRLGGGTADHARAAVRLGLPCGILVR